MDRSKHSSGNTIRICLLIFFGISFAVSAFMSSRILLERKAADDAYASLRMNSQTSEAEFTNTKVAYGSLSVSKTIADNAADSSKAFDFTVTLDDTSVNGAYGDMTFTDGVASFSLKDGESMTAVNLPAGTGYTVSETDHSAEGYETAKTGDTGIIVKDRTAKVTANNILIVSDKKDGISPLQTDGTDATKETRSDEAEAARPEPVPRVSMDFESMLELGPDIKAWLFAEGTNIDYPVVKTDDNDYYLTHLYNGETNSSGALFIDYRNTGLFTDQNTVIYGHHMRNGTMFGSLNLYKGQDFYDEYPTMLLYTPDGDYLVELVCGTVESGDYEFVRFDFKDEDDFHSYIESCRSRSTFRSNVEVDGDDRIVTLCTCSYEWDNARYMIMGKLTPIMEASIR